ncbi:AUGMIN subunit 2 isoform X1 [Amborella trichopoda]|uniref:AUGMIN subunit 2 isoform X1 n=1 Tax=Amborella trichopoda TaxID=13333 RepID=UPI0009BD47E2|nr:AUGMIN subunit 2 isoform X1 [Amborella trichopoda]|eukprot:XP_020522158.1 AUGMIN subunit 2 isoform X1 [Amborella trichopoda]
MMAMAGDSTWVGKKPLRRLGGMADALSLASDLGFSIPSVQDDTQSSPNTSTTPDKSDALVRVLRELTLVQRNLANLQVELQGRKDDKSVAHLTHVSEMEEKCESLARYTAILKDVIQNKDRIIARLQQPYSLDCIPVEAEYQGAFRLSRVLSSSELEESRLNSPSCKTLFTFNCIHNQIEDDLLLKQQFSELLIKAASDYGALTASVADFQWSQNFKEPPSIWGEMLRPIPVALASCTRFFEATTAMRESFAALQKLRVGSTSARTPSKGSQGRTDPECMTPPHWKPDYIVDEPCSDDPVIRTRRRQEEVVMASMADLSEFGDTPEVDSFNRRLSWPPSNMKST